MAHDQTRGELVPNGAVGAGHTAPGSDHRAPQSPAGQSSFGRTLWEAWKAYSHRAGSYQAEVLLSVVYFFVLGPSTLIAAATGKRLLDVDRKPRPSYWIVRPPAEKTLAALERQF